eukprot:CAMPEP_0118878062 /NCGR_PEP_ID=MMETSP1163-20130328/18091_1 /TAXON_ID=124430 /ORGANISM="Phaeomonas parva, Strain CCMP2877" /LENGTH=194 /DNA_ID=CAMNT_0006813845 /DNA_START=39 /DNA_END=623 /DNA_ORIENTATION=-
MMMRLAKIAGMIGTAAAFAPRRMATRGAGALRMLSEGDSVPMDGEFMVLKDGPTGLSYSDVFKGKKVVLFGVPGAMTPTCSEAQLPGYIKAIDDMKAKGVDTVACVSVNDPFVMSKWAEASDSGDILMLGDGGAEFVNAADIGFDTGGFGGVRCTRMSMLVDDGKVVKLNLEDGGSFTEGPEAGSSAEYMLTQL